VTWYATPTAKARARRMQIDEQNRILVTEYRTSRPRCSTPRRKNTSRIQPAAVHVPYRAHFDKNGDSGPDDEHDPRRAARSQDGSRAIPDAGRHNMRTVFVDNSTTR